MQKYPALVWHCQTLLSIVDTPQHPPAFSGSPWWEEFNMATSPLPSRGPHGEESSIWLHNCCLLGVPMVGRVQYGYITAAFSGSPWWGEFNMRDGKCVKMVENGQKWVTIQMCHIRNA